MVRTAGAGAAEPIDTNDEAAMTGTGSGPRMVRRRNRVVAGVAALILTAVSYTHLTLPTN